MSKILNSKAVRLAVLRLLVVLDDEGFTKSRLSYLLWEVFLNHPVIITITDNHPGGFGLSVDPEIPHKVVFKPGP